MHIERAGSVSSQADTSPIGVNSLLAAGLCCRDVNANSTTVCKVTALYNLLRLARRTLWFSKKERYKNAPRGENALAKETLKSDGSE